MKKILITGAVGFVGSFLSKKLLSEGYKVIGIDNMNDYYDIKLKESRLNQLIVHNNFTFIKGNIADKNFIFSIFKDYEPDYVINLAAQAGVRYSIDNPDVYIESNINGFFNVLEACRNYPVDHLIYASSSSVYGNNTKVPFEETDNVDSPVSLYAATKKSNELMASTYSHLYNIPVTGLRFFTVYGPQGRPDMAYYKFADKFFNGETIHIYNDGDYENDLYRDFTYIDDIIEGIVKLLPLNTNSNGKPYHEVFNIGNNTPIKLMDFIKSLEKAFSDVLGVEIEFKKEYESIKPGDVPATYASTDKLQNATGYKPTTSIEAGLAEFAKWYVEFYKLTNFKGE